MQKNYSSSKAVQFKIDQLIEKRDYLRLLFSLTSYKDCTLMFSASHKIEGRGFHFVRQEHFPFNLEQEFKMLLEDAISNYNSDIATLNQHLKNI
jgi:hypothetical protein